MRIHALAAVTLAIALCTAARGADYVLDVTRLDATYRGKPDPGDPPDSLRSRSIEIGVVTGGDFYNRVQIGDEIVVVKGRLTEDKSGDLWIKFSLTYQSDVKDRKVRAGTKNETSLSTQLKVVAGQAVSAGGFMGTLDATDTKGQRTIETTQRCIFIRLDRPPAKKKEDAQRRKRVAEQHRKLLRENLNSWLKKK